MPPAANNLPDVSLFTLEGFDDDLAYEEETDGANIGDVAFPQSDDEDNSTNGKHY